MRATLAGCVYVVIHGETGYFGMLSIDPARQGQGLGRQLIAAAEAHCRNAGCRQMELEVVNLRTELPPFYRRFGYAETGTRPFPDQRAGEAPLPLHRHDEVPAAGRLAPPDANDFGGPCSRLPERDRTQYSCGRSLGRISPRSQTLQEDGWLLGVGRLCVRRCCWQARQLFPAWLQARAGTRQTTAQAPADDNTVPSDLRPLLAAPESELRLVTQRYNTDRTTLNGNYDGGRGPGRGGRGGDGRGRGTDAAPAAPAAPPHRRRPCRSRPTGSRG